MSHFNLDKSIQKFIIKGEPILVPEAAMETISMIASGVVLSAGIYCLMGLLLRRSPTA